MSNNERCKNLNHGRAKVTIRFCIDCGEKLNSSIYAKCDEEKHAIRRKERTLYCCDCGKKLR